MTTIATAPVGTPSTLNELSGSYTVDAAHTRVGFVARHAMVTKVRGQFNDFEGSGVVDAADFTKSSVTVTIQAASIDTRNEQRDAHLRSNDFLAMEDYPQITFTSTGMGFVRVSPVHAPSMALDVDASSGAAGADIQQWTYLGGNNQQWRFIDSDL